jgi:hypothetical protein
MRERRKMIGELLQKLYDEVLAFAPSSPTSIYIYEECKTKIYSSAIQQLEEMRLWLQQDEDAITLSVEQLSSKISDIKPIEHIFGCYCSFRNSCYDEWQFKKVVKSILKADHNPVLPSHTKHMEKVRESLGM